MTALDGFGETCDDTAYNWNYRPKNHVDVIFAEHQSDISPKPSFIFDCKFLTLIMFWSVRNKFFPSPRYIKDLHLLVDDRCFCLIVSI